MKPFGGLILPDTSVNEDILTNSCHHYSLPGGFFDRNRSVGSGHEEHSSTSETIIDGIENTSELTAQRMKRSVENEFNDISGPRRKKARKFSPTTAEITPENKAIQDKSKESPTRVFQELFKSKHHADKSLETIIELHRKPVSDCSFPADDESFPKTDEEYRQRVRQVFDAICDWSHILEWRTVLPKGQENRISAEFSQDRPERRQGESMDDPLADFMPTEAELVKILPPVEDQQRRVLRQIPNDQTIEWISWGIVVFFFLFLVITPPNVGSRLLTRFRVQLSSPSRGIPKFHTGASRKAVRSRTKRLTPD